MWRVEIFVTGPLDAPITVVDSAEGARARAGALPQSTAGDRLPWRREVLAVLATLTPPRTTAEACSVACSLKCDTNGPIRAARWNALTDTCEEHSGLRLNRLSKHAFQLPVKHAPLLDDCCAWRLTHQRVDRSTRTHHEPGD
jgi:hypothetical protein